MGVKQKKIVKKSLRLFLYVIGLVLAVGSLALSDAMVYVTNNVSESVQRFFRVGTQ